MSKRISFESLPEIEAKTEIVLAPEFGVDDDGDSWETLVRGLTIAEYQQLGKMAFDISMSSSSDNGQDDGPTRTIQLREDHDEMCVVAGWCTIDDEGKLLFGPTDAVAVARVRTLPKSEYQELIERIYDKVLELSGIERQFTRRKSKAETKKTVVETAIDNAEKN
jgi:hypothetical protein